MTVSITPAPAVRRNRTGERRVSARRAPERVPELAQLSLGDLRTYRQELVQEEARISYWRRLLHARMDLMAEEIHTVGRLREVLKEHLADSHRLAHMPFVPVDQPPPLPDLAVLWDITDNDPGSLARLAAVEKEVSSYRRALHERLDVITAELIARYREHPALALAALPTVPPRSAR